jgi:hypothetical protein
LSQFFPGDLSDDARVFVLDDVESPDVIATMDEDQRHRARIRLMRTYEGAVAVIGEMLLASPEPVGQRRGRRQEAERSVNVTYHDRMFLYNELYRRAKLVYPEASRQSIAIARRQNSSQRRLRSRAVTPPSEMPNCVIIPLNIYVNSFVFIV